MSAALAEIIDALQAHRDVTAAELERIDQALAWLTAEDDEAGEVGEEVAVATVTAIASRPAPEVDPQICPHCGDVLPSRRGLAVHVGLKHKIAKGTFDPQKAREMAAAAL